MTIGFATSKIPVKKITSSKIKNPVTRTTTTESRATRKGATVLEEGSESIGNINNRTHSSLNNLHRSTGEKSYTLNSEKSNWKLKPEIPRTAVKNSEGNYTLGRGNEWSVNNTVTSVKKMETSGLNDVYKVEINNGITPNYAGESGFKKNIESSTTNFSTNNYFNPITDLYTTPVSDVTKSLFENSTSYTSKTLMTPENYYNVRASNGYLSYGSQQSIERNIGNIINDQNYYNGGYRIPYDGVKRASAYLQEIGMGRADRVEKLQSFEVGTIQIRQAGAHEYGIRYFDVLEGYNGATAEGQYLNNTFTPLTNRANLALPPSWNKAYYIQQWQIKPGTIILTGKVGPQLDFGPQYVGGAVQTYIYKPWEKIV